MAWSPTQYLKFENERNRPPRELLAQVPLDRISTAIDLGCGPGNSTELLVERFGAVGISGVDSDRNMLEAARKRLPGIPFTEADLSTWQPDEPVDLLFANALFQWLPDHLEIFDRLMDSLRPGGVLAIQMPDNLEEPSHRLMEETAHDGPWRDAFKNNSPRRKPMAPPTTYYNRLAPKASHVEVWHTFYHHPLKNAAAIVEMVKSTGLRPYLEIAGAERQEAFTADYLARVTKAYPTLSDGRVLFRFPRFFIMAVKK